MHIFVVNAAGEVAESATVIDVRALAVLGSVLVPLVVQLITKRTASEGLKAALGLLGSVLVTVLAFVVDPGDTVVNWITITNVFITSLVTQLTAYLAVYKPLGVAGSIAAKTGGFGIGSPPTVELEDKGAEDAPEAEGYDDEEAEVVLQQQTLTKPPLHDAVDGDPLDHVGPEVPRDGKNAF